MSEATTEWQLPESDSELEELMKVQVEPLPEEGELVVGTVVTATVASVDADPIELTLNETTKARCPLADAKAIDGKLPAVGETLDVLLEDRDEDGNWQVSIDKARQLERFDEMERVAKDGGQIDATITVALRNGLSADFDGFRCFVPYSESGISRELAPTVVGQSFRFEIQRLDRKNAQLVLSRKAFAAAERADAFRSFAEAHKEGEIVSGTVTRITDFGAFVALSDEVEGLLHVSELSTERVDHPGVALASGDEVQVQILSIDTERQRIGLSRREVERQQTREAMAALSEGDIIEGTVDDFAPFGAFITFGEGLRGLCHISELSWTERVNHPSELLEKGQQVRARILGLDPKETRISLSIRGSESDPFAEFLAEHPVGSKVTGKITRVEDYGLFVELTEGIEGLCHVSDLTWEGRPDTPADAGEFNVGDEIEVMLLQAEGERRRIGLGVKQLSGDPWDDAGERVTPGTIFTGRVSRLDEHAAFIELVPGLEGRLHISEISVERVESIRSALRIGQEVEVMTKAADRSRRRIDLSIKAIEEKRIADQPRSWDDSSSMGDLATALKESGLVAEAEKNEEN